MSMYIQLLYYNDEKSYPRSGDTKNTAVHIKKIVPIKFAERETRVEHLDNSQIQEINELAKNFGVEYNTDRETHFTISDDDRIALVGAVNDYSKGRKVQSARSVDDWVCYVNANTGRHVAVFVSTSLMVVWDKECKEGYKTSTIGLNFPLNSFDNMVARDNYDLVIPSDATGGIYVLNSDGKTIDKLN